jgi:hypothetical protein
MERQHCEQELDELEDREYIPAHSTARSKSAPSKKELRRICIQRDRGREPDFFPERELEQSASAMLR